MDRSHISFGKARVLILDDDPAVRFAVREFLELRGFEILEARGYGEAKTALWHEHIDAAVLDYELPDGNALMLLSDLKSSDVHIPTVILTAHGSIDLAVSAIKEGAENFLTKPVELGTLSLLLNRILENQRNRLQQFNKQRLSGKPLDPFLGESPALRELAEQCVGIANSDVSLIIEGETGTGKGVLARWMHRHSPRKDRAFVDINCAGLSEELLESELFGHEKGAFTGAVNSKPGLLEVANRGTLFLDEIGDMHPAVQSKLLKAVEDKQFRRLGSVQNRAADFRLIAATHRDLTKLVAEEKFRSDLFYRISTIRLGMPSLRDRREDIAALSHEILVDIAKELGRPAIELAPEGLIALLDYLWPGNVRELRNVLERAVLLSRNSTLSVKDLRLQHDVHPGGASTLAEAERAHIQKILKLTKNNISQAARTLGISKSTLYSKMREMNLPFENRNGGPTSAL